jgi:rhodanese-related sulfurtransferase
MPKTLSREELQAKLASKTRPVVLEGALPAKYFLDGHLPGALHMPHDRVRALARAVVRDKGADIVVYCASRTCQNSHIAAETLTSLGYTNVSVYGAGKQDWVEAGLPLEKGGEAQAAA